MVGKELRASDDNLNVEQVINMSDYIKLTLKIGLYLAIFFASMIVFPIIGMILAMIFGVCMRDLPMAEMAFMGGTGTIFSIFIFWLMLKNKERDLVSLCKFEKISLKHSLLSIPITIGFSAFAMIYSALVYKYGLIPDIEVYMELIQQIVMTVPGVIAIVIIAPITEEILFRGLIFNFLREKISLTSSIIIQALLFGVIHLNMFQGIFAFAAGILFAYVYVWTKSIWAVIIVHALTNLFAVVSMILEIPYMVGYVIVAIGVIIFMPSLWLLYKQGILKGEKV